MLLRMQGTGSLCIAGWNVKWYSQSGKQFDSFLKNKHATPTQHSSYTLGHLSQKNENLCLHKNL